MGGRDGSGASCSASLGRHDKSAKGIVAAKPAGVKTVSFARLSLRRAGLLLSVWLLAASETAVCSLVSANLLTNGGFEQNNRTTYTNYYPGDDVAYLPLGDELPGWTFSHSVDLYGAPNQPHGGNQFLDLVGGGPLATDFWVQQTFATVPGELYGLSFFYGNNEFLASATASFIASIIGASGVIWTETFTHTGDTMNSRNWTEGGALFRADSTSTTLLFRDSSHFATDYNPDYTVGGSTLDDVSIFAVVPESGTLAAGLFALGFVVVELLRRHRAAC